MTLEEQAAALREAFPMLDFYLSYGAAFHALVQAEVRREDIQIVLYQGQLRVGYADQSHEDMGDRTGTRFAEPIHEEVVRAALMASALPRKVTA